MKQYKLSLIIVIFIFLGAASNSQPIPDEYKKGSIPEQLNYLEAHTRIYENFRAVREDIFQIITRNTKDTLAGSNKRINNYMLEIATLNSRIDSFNKSLETTKISLEETTQMQNSISVLGVGINKTVYNIIMWSIIGIIALMLFIGYVIFKKNRDTTVKTKSELIDLQQQFEEYKQKKRIEIENLTMSHFNEIKKLKK